MKRLALLVAGALAATTLAFSSNVAAWYETQAQKASYYDSVDGSGYNLGGALKHGYSGPATDVHPQFYAGAETHTAVGHWNQYNPGAIRITVTGVDPNGVQL